MKQIALIIFSLLTSSHLYSQSFQSTDTIKAPTIYDNIYSRLLYSDSLASSFIIFIKKEVKKHKHVSHSEHVYILEGEGEMLFDDKIIKVKEGDILFIPKNTPHSFKTISATPAKIISVQTPYFDGKDRVILE